ncbi:hypothetical protein RFI_39079 [Reticulomyxa filosa]|uniref:Uncharacterized protein n=1 Tax=Reticulomyxa filosa TaxID=46433 RepID=X6LA77_RETFI|nr:hypothetical protein RFI_39079 [Reticulomyxa filosa]|eukprot:ETN98423.1 hypothetical protein RFI_39079 [Reticulomyxa filosa]
MKITWLWLFQKFCIGFLIQNKYEILNDNHDNIFVVSIVFFFVQFAEADIAKLLFRPKRVELESTIANEIFKMEMLTEMKDLTEDLQTAINVPKNEKPATELDRIVSKNKQRYDAIQQALDSSTVLSLKVIIVEQTHLLFLLEPILMQTLPPLKKRQLLPMIYKLSWPMKILFGKSLSNICKTLLSRICNHKYDIYYIYYTYISFVCYMFVQLIISKKKNYFLIIKDTNSSGVVVN